MDRLVTRLNSMLQIHPEAEPPTPAASASRPETDAPATVTVQEVPGEAEGQRASGVHPAGAQIARGRFNAQVMLRRARGLDREAAAHFSYEELRDIDSLPVMQRVRVLSNATQREQYTDLAEMLQMLSRPSSQQHFYQEHRARLEQAGFSRSQVLTLIGHSRNSSRYIAENLEFFGLHGFSPENMLFIAAHADSNRRRLLIAGTPALLDRHWTPDDIARGLDNSVYNNGDLQLNWPSLRMQEQSRLRFVAEQARLEALAASEPREGALIAAGRWGGNQGDITARAAQAFSNELLKRDLRLQLQESTTPESKNLLVLVAGLPFTADYRNAALRGEFIERAKRVFDYIDAAHDPELLSDCAREATDTIERCGDRLSHGLTRIEQTVECHRMVAGKMSAAQVFTGIRRHFNQMLVEEQAIQLARHYNEDESVEIYFSLALGLVRKGVELEEGAKASLYAERGAFALDNSAIDRVHALILMHHEGPSPELKALFNSHPAVEKALTRHFADDYELLIKVRNDRAEAAAERLFDEHASDATKRQAERDLDEAGKAEANWFAKKVKRCLKHPELLG